MPLNRTVPQRNLLPGGGIDRRSALRQIACGFGGLAATSLISRPASAGLTDSNASIVPRARRIIFLFMQGGPSQVDSFDYKLELQQRDGDRFDFHDARMIANSGTVQLSSQRLMKSPWQFHQRGESGLWVSDLFPRMAEHADKLCVIRSLHTEGVAHGPATLFLHCGSTNLVRPSMGSWVVYGLGSENENLPGFVSIAPSLGNGGARNYGNAFLPAKFQAAAIARGSTDAGHLSIGHLNSNPVDRDARRRQFELIRDLSQHQVNRLNDDRYAAVLESMELAWRMQDHAPDAFDLSREDQETLEMYGVGHEPTDRFGRQCLLARRLAEAGVRFIQVTYGDNTANPAWDQHSNLLKHSDHAAAVDQPVAALLADLERRGLLDDTLVWWGGEFGRTPYAEKNGTGRDHNPGGFSIWLAGGGVRPGVAYGETDEFGHRAVVDKVHMHDLHATLLHLLGLDHERLTFRYSGRNFRLTDVYGRVVHSIVG